MLFIALFFYLAFFQLAFRFGVCRYLVYQLVLFLVTDVLSHCYTFSLKLLLCFSFPGMRSSLVCFLMTDVIYCIPIAFCVLCFWLEKFSLLLPHSRCNSLHLTFLVFFQLAFRFRVCRYLVYQLVLFLVTDVLSHCYTFSLKLLLCFSFPGMRSSLVCFLMTDVIYCIPIAFCVLCFWLEKFSLLLPHSRCNSLHLTFLGFLQLAFRFGFAGF